METYEKLLDEAYKKVKQIHASSDRFEIPEIRDTLEGKKTIIVNFMQIASYIRRTPEHFQKFLLKELASAGERKGERLILNVKVPQEKIKQKIEEYVKKFVLCKECKKPDTEIIKEDRVSFIHCLACGAKYPISKV